VARHALSGELKDAFVVDLRQYQNMDESVSCTVMEKARNSAIGFEPR
jgi:hypothetical protein